LSARHLALPALALAAPQAGCAQALTPKVACDFQDPLCSLKARFIFGAAVINNTAYYSGGLDANAPTYPLSGSYLEAVDINTLAPRTLQTVPDAQLNTSRYRQQLAPWGDDRIVMVGGQFDDRNGASVKTMTMVTLDLASREWQLKRSFWQGNGGEPLGRLRLLSKELFMSIVQMRLCSC
jgi:hypothetical protein